MKEIKITKQIIYTIIVFVSLFMLRSCSSPDCGENKSEYQDGYVMGKTVRSMGETFSCNSFVKVYNAQGGRNLIYATDCFCKGYKDGLHGQSTKY